MLPDFVKIEGDICTKMLNVASNTFVHHKICIISRNAWLKFILWTVQGILSKYIFSHCLWGDTELQKLTTAKPTIEKIADHLI